MNDANGSSRNNLDRVTMRALSDDVTERLWAYEDLGTAEEQPPFNVAGSFATLGFISAAVRRRRRFWLAWAAIGMLVGLGIFVKYPVSYQAKVTVLVKNNPGQDPVASMLTQVTLAQSHSVAANTVKALGLTQSVSSFQAAYSAAVVTDQVFTITLSAPTAAGAVQRANMLAAQYLKFRASLLLAQQAQDVAANARQVPEAQQQIASLQGQISQLQGQPSQQARLAKLQDQLKTATAMLPTLEQTITGMTASEKSTTSTMIDGSQVLNAAALVHHSKLKDVIEYVLSGLIGGLAIGLGTVIVRELTSDRLRRRDDIAAALGRPVRLSVGPVARGRLPVGGPAAASRTGNLRHVAVHLSNAVPPPGRMAATLAVVAVDNAQDIAPAVVMMAERCAKDGMQIIVADLVAGAPVARLLGVNGSGMHAVRVAGTSVVVAIPDPDEVVPLGPVRSATGAGPFAAAPAAELVSVAQQASLLITVAQLDPAIGAEHLATWADTAVAVFTAGRTRVERAYAVGEMLRLSGVHAISGIVVGADKTDESLGTAPDAAAPAGAQAPEPASHAGRSAAGNGGKPEFPLR